MILCKDPNNNCTAIGTSIENAYTNYTEQHYNIKISELLFTVIDDNPTWSRYKREYVKIEL